MQQLLRRFAREESGATMVEYGVMVALVAAVAVVAIGVLGTKVSSTFETISTKIGA